MIFPTDDSPAANDQESHFANAKALLSELIRVPELAAVLEEQGCLHASRVDTQAPTLWLHWRLACMRALAGAAKHKHPHRSRPRSCPRVAHPRRPKTTKFQKTLRKKTPDPPD